MESGRRRRPGWATALALFCAATVLFLAARDLFVPDARGTEVWLGIEVHGWLARVTAPLHWGIFALGAWGFWRLRPWIWPWASVYAFLIAGSHLVWNLTSSSGGGWGPGLLQLALFSVPAFALLWARPPRRGMEEPAVPLSGGRVTPGVVRVGNTVRRPLGPHSPFVHELLRHLESMGFPHAPRLLGIDAEGREMLQYVEGCVPGQLRRFPDAALREGARLLARFHDATAGSLLAGDQEVVRHGDPSPCNFVFRDGLPVCLIDFDAALPGPRRIDVGYAAWTWLDLGNPELDPREAGRRLARFMEAYGAHVPADPVQSIVDAQAWLEMRASRHDTPFDRGVARWARHCQRWMEVHRLDLERELREPPDRSCGATRDPAGSA